MRRNRTKKDRNAQLGNEQGATVVETAIVSGLAWCLIAGCMDFARYLTVLVLLTQSAQRGIATARSIPGLDNCTPGGTVDCSGAATAITSVRDILDNIPLNTIFSTATGAPQRLVRWDVLLPGTGHADYPDPLCRATMTGPDATMQNVLYRCPVVIRMEADVRFMLPVLGTKRIVVQTSGFRERAVSDEQAFPEADYFPS